MSSQQNSPRAKKLLWTFLILAVLLGATSGSSHRWQYSIWSMSKAIYLSLGRPLSRDNGIWDVTTWIESGKRQKMGRVNSRLGSISFLSYNLAWSDYNTFQNFITKIMYECVCVEVCAWVERCLWRSEDVNSGGCGGPDVDSGSQI